MYVLREIRKRKGDVRHKSLPAHDITIDRIVRIFVVHDIVDLELGDRRSDDTGRVFAQLAMEDDLRFQQYTEMTLLQGNPFFPSFKRIQARTRRIGVGIRQDVLQTTSSVFIPKRLAEHLHCLRDTFILRRLDVDGFPWYRSGRFCSLLVPNEFDRSKSYMSRVQTCRTLQTYRVARWYSNPLLEREQ